jgi:hypothetical protein
MPNRQKQGNFKTNRNTMNKFELAEKILDILDEADLTVFDKMAIIVDVKRRLTAENKMRMQQEIFEQLKNKTNGE